MSNLDRVRSFWKRASEYPTDKEKEYPQHAQIQEFDVLNEAGERWLKGKRVLEYGCGGGSDTASYVKRGAEVWCADVTPDNVLTTATRVPTAHPLILQQSGSIPLANETIDIVSSHGVLHHIEDIAPVMRELRRVLVPGGFLYMMLYTEHLFEMFREKILVLTQEHKISVDEAFGWCTDEPGCPYARSYKTPEAKDLLERNGFGLIWAKEYDNRNQKGEIVSLPIFRTYKARKG